MMDEYTVKVHIYDLTKGLARSLSGPLLGRQLDGVWHTGIVVHGQEFYFGGMGIESCPPCGTMLGPPDKAEVLGKTQVPLEMFLGYLQELGASSFRPETYHLLEHNCNTFSDEIAKFLTGRPIPEYITNLPQEVLNTPLGAMIKPFLDAMSVSPGGGHSVQPQIPQSTPDQTVHPQTGQTTGAHPQAKETTDVHPQTVRSGGDGATSSDHHSLSLPLVSFRELDSVLSDWIKVHETFRTSLSSADVGLLEEITEYLKASEPDWSLSTSHITILGRILREPGFTEAQKMAASGLLQESLSHEDVVMMLVHDSHDTYATILRLFEQHDTSVNERLSKGLCNSSSHKAGLTWLMSSKSSNVDEISQVSLDVCRHCLLHTDKSLNLPGAALCHNITSNKVSEELAFDMGCALVELLQRDIDTETAKYGLVALCQCMNRNAEVGSIATVSGLNMVTFVDKHPELKNLCDNQLKDCLSKLIL